MTDLTSQVQPMLENHRLGNLKLGEEMLLPFYQGYSLVNIPCTIARLLGTPDFAKQPLNEVITAPIGGPYEKVILLLIDGLGDGLLHRLMALQKDLFWHRYFDRAVYSPITSVCPSTTASALTTFWLGEGPAAHGIIGYEMWMKEYGLVVNNVLHSPAAARGDIGGISRFGFNPKTHIGKPTLGTHLRDHGVHSTAYIHASIARSGLSTMQMKDVEVHPYVDEADLLISLAENLNRRKGFREYIYVYYSDVDTLSHRYGGGDQRIPLQFKAFTALFEEAFISKLSKAAGQDALLILTADHGSKDTPKDPQFDLANHPSLLEHLVMQPTCEHRFAFLFIKPGRMGAVSDYFEHTWPGSFNLVNPEEALNHGLFGEGPIKANTLERLGDLIAVARGEAFLWWPVKPNIMLGRHGGLNREEMLVPFYALRLSDLNLAG